jgi:hypothetical protein
MKQFKSLREETLEEKLKASDPAGTYIHDFVHSDNPKFAGKSKAKRIQMALAASYAAKGKSKNEDIEYDESVDEGMMNAVKTMAKKATKALTGGSDEDQLKNLQKKMGVPQTGKKPTSEETELDEVNMTAHIKRQATRLKMKAGGIKTNQTTTRSPFPAPTSTSEGTVQDVANSSLNVISKTVSSLNKNVKGKDPSSLVGTQTK